MPDGIKTKKKGNGDLQAPNRKEQEARLKQFSPVQNARVKQAMAQSQNGFKGQDLNDHGLPEGGSDIIQAAPMQGEDGAKFRRVKSNVAKLETGTKGIKVKKK